MKLSIRGILITGILAIGANTLLVAQTANPWFEGWYRAKFGRPSPTKEARLQAGRITTASRVEKPAQSAAPVNTWFEGWYRAKYGRPSPQEEARLKAQSN